MPLTLRVVIPQIKPINLSAGKAWSRVFFPMEAAGPGDLGFIWPSSPTLSPGYSLMAGRGDEEEEEGGFLHGGWRCPRTQLTAPVSCGDLCACQLGPCLLPLALRCSPALQ